MQTSLSLDKIYRFFHCTIKSKFVRNVAIVATGTASAQAITMAFAPIITRLYGPEAFGLLGIFMAIVAVLTPIAALSYPIAIVLPKEDSNAKGVAKLSSYIALGIACVLTVVLLVKGNWLLKLLNLQAVSAYILLIPLVMLFSAWLQIVQQWLIRKKQFKITARVAALQALILNSAKMGIGLFKPVAAVLIVISAVGTALHVLMLAIGAKKADAQNRQEKNPHSKSSQWDLAKNYYDFPVYRAPQMFINALSQGLPVLMLASFFGPAPAGYYALCQRVLHMPGQLIGGSVGQVFYPTIADAKHRGENLTRLIVKTTLGLASVGFLPFALVVAFGPWLFGVVFGNEWVVAGEYARWLALWIFFAFINRPSVASIPVLRLQGFFLIYEIFSVLLRVLILVISFYIFKSDVLAILLFSLAGVVLNLSLIVMTICRSNYSRTHGRPLK